MPCGPKCLRWCIVRPSGPTARELPPCRMALETACVVKGEAVLSSGRLFLRFRLTRRAFGSEVCETIDVNCLLKAVAMSLSSVSVVLLKVMGWLGAAGGRLPERVRRRDQKREGFCL